MKTIKRITKIFTVVVFMITIMIIPVIVNAQTADSSTSSSLQLSEKKSFIFVKEATPEELKTLLKGYKEGFGCYRNARSFLKNYQGYKFLIVSGVGYYGAIKENYDLLKLDGINPYLSKVYNFHKSYWDEEKGGRMVKTVTVVVNVVKK